MSTLTASPEYIELLKKFPPRVIRTEKENEACTELLYELDRRSSKLTPAEKELADLLTLLIEDFEDRHYQLPRAKPLEVLQFLMDQHGLFKRTSPTSSVHPASSPKSSAASANSTRITLNASAAASTSPPNSSSSFLRRRAAGFM